MKNKKDLYEGVPVTSLMTRQRIYDNRHAEIPWWLPAFDKGDWTVVAMTAALILCLVGIAMIPGCAAPVQADPNPSLVFHVSGTLYDPVVTPEYSRNDKYMGIRTDDQRERYQRHLSLIIKTTDRQSTINGRIVDRHTTDTKTTERK